jgi:hypothetical protein
MAAEVGLSRSYLLAGTLLMKLAMVLDDLLVAEILDSTATMSLPSDFFIFKVL